MSRLALATSIAHIGVGIGHTFFGIDLFSKPEWKSLPKLFFAYSRVGWYQGGAFFTIIGLYTYQLSQRDPSTWTSIDRTILAMTLALYWASSAWYLKNGDRSTGALTGVVGALQALCLAQ
ncbi:hypothetical protein EDD37DRAFT_652747 [Exophiala viscosa]|uniref:Uncharacterized protein n=1 Tax=Exophiala viscosa TaxID=2486360 RepID=A0AAN6E0V1_9EURO|nr:hypothetical protein EDD36DRAFT_230910 [Exophiala viscosa]KAI1621381.1 hypothetical protein EDD37DRAFT_652747 [Exophiala viscosa]